MNTDTHFKAIVVRETADGFTRQVEDRTIADLPADDVLIQVRYSSLNYKDALSANGNRGVTRAYPHTPGIDAVGQVAEISPERNDVAFAPGDWVITGGYDLGMNTDGGFGQYIRVPAQWVLPLPTALHPLAAMTLGTAGFTAALSLYKLESSGLRPDMGKVLVTGATGGVGSVAIALLAKAGYHVVAATGKLDQAPFLKAHGAAEVIERQELETGGEKALLKQRWIAVLDTVGGQILANAIKSTAANGWVTTCGNVASGDLPLTVYPFILRGVTLLGIDAANVALEIRAQLLKKLTTTWHIDLPDDLTTVVDLAGILPQIDRTLRGQQVGRVVLDLWPELTAQEAAPHAQK